MQAPDQGTKDDKAGVDGTIVKVCGTLYGTRLGGVSALCRPVSPPVDSPRYPSNASEEDVDGGSLEYVRLDSPEGEEWMEFDETLDAKMAKLGLRITDRASRYFIIKRQLVMDLRKMDTKHPRVETQINGHTLHPLLRIAMPFEGNDQDRKNTLVRGKDFLNAYNRRRRVQGKMLTYHEIGHSQP
jgi:hypothetical protein